MVKDNGGGTVNSFVNFSDRMVFDVKPFKYKLNHSKKKKRGKKWKGFKEK